MEQTDPTLGGSQVATVTESPILLQGAIITTTSTTVAFNYQEAPIEPEPEPVLMEGATTAEAEAAALDETSTEVPLINGGVVLAPESTSTVEGQEKLAQILSTPPDEVFAGARPLEPFGKYLGGAFFVDSCSSYVHKNSHSSDCYRLRWHEWS